MDKAIISINDKSYDCPVVTGSENEKGIDISKFRAQSGCITLDPGYGNTGSCQSAITFINGEKGILRYRGYPIEELAQNSDFIEVALLLIWGELPTAEQRQRFTALLTNNALLHENMKHNFEGFPWNSHPMAMLSAMVNALSCYHPSLVSPQTPKQLESAAAKLISKIRTIAAFSYKMVQGEPFIYPDSKLSYSENLLHMIFSVPNERYEVLPEAKKAIDLLLLLHADHEQNCSTSTVRMVASSKANLFASIASGVLALWGPLHGGANQAVVEMLENIHEGEINTKKCIEMAKDKDSDFRLMGFGHRVYKNFDPRALILKDAADKLLKRLGRNDPLMDIARELEDAALNDPYFIEHKLYPNVDFYSGLILRAIGVPKKMFTVFFAIGRLPGWIAQWREVAESGVSKIDRPRQIYIGPKERHYPAVK